MSWLSDELEASASEILETATRLAAEGGVTARSTITLDEFVKQTGMTLELLVEVMAGHGAAPLLERWEAIGRTCAEREAALSEIPNSTDFLKRAIWEVLKKAVDRGEVGFSELVDSMMEVESVLGDCRFALVHSYLGSRSVAESASTARLEAMYSLTELLSTESDEYQIYRTLVDRVAGVTGLVRCTLLIFDQESRLVPVASNFTDSIENLLMLRDDTLRALAESVADGDPLVLERRADLEPDLAALLEIYHTPTLLLAPLKTDVRQYGVMLLDEAQAGEFSPEQVELAMAVANQAAAAIEKSSLLVEMETRLKHMAAIGIVARTLPSYLDPREQLDGMLEIATAIVKADRGMILLPDEMFDELKVAAKLGPEDWDAAGPSVMEVARWVYDNGQPVLFERTAEDPRFSAFQSGMEASVTAPLTVRDKSIGVISVGTARRGETYSNDDLELFSNFAAQAAISVENTQLYERLQDTYLGAIGSLAAAIEARDPYTVGHSARVTQYAVAIAEAMGLTQDQIEELRLAGLLHDLGKIGVPDRILNKPGMLTEEEYSAIKMHPALSMRIIEPLPQLGNIIPIIYHHHEHYDGSGYVDGKAGDKIPLGARIIAVADAFEAMTSDRPYRTALTREQAMSELRRNSGSQFDPQVVGHFIDLLEQTAQQTLS
jgi:HD-GYP domain-containing protein (c-di-GMP phosphodiesterase class II)